MAAQKKRLLCIALIIVLPLLLSALHFLAKPEFSQTTRLQEATGWPTGQCRLISKLLHRHQIAIHTIDASSSPLVVGMEESYAAYDIEDSVGNSYVLILSHADGEFAALLDSSGELLNGLIDPSITPVLFPE